MTAFSPGSSQWRSWRSAQEVTIDVVTFVQYLLLMFSTKLCSLVDVIHVSVIAVLLRVSAVVTCLAGGWRTLSEWEVMFKKAGFTLEKSEGVGASMHLMVWNQI